MAAAVSSDVHPNVHHFTTGTSAENRANAPFLSDDLDTGLRGKKAPSFRSMNVSSTPEVSGETSKQKRQSSLQLRQIGIEIPSTAPATAAQGRLDQTRVSTSGSARAELFGGGANVDTDSQFTVLTSKNKYGSATDARIPTDGQFSVGGMTESATNSTVEAECTAAATVGTHTQPQLAEDAEVASRTKMFTGAEDLTTLLATKMGITDPEECAQLETRLAEILASCGKRLREENFGVMSLVHVLGDILKWQTDLQKKAHEKARLLEGENAACVAKTVRISEDLSNQAKSHAEAEATVQLLGDEKANVESEIADLSRILANALTNLTEETELRKEAKATVRCLQAEKADVEAENARLTGTLAEKTDRVKEAEETIQRLRDEKVEVEADNARLAGALTEKTDSLKEAEAEIQRLQGEKAHFKSSADHFHLKDAFIGASALFGHMVFVPRVWDAILGGESAIFRQHLGGIWIFMCFLAPLAMAAFVSITKKGSNDIP